MTAWGIVGILAVAFAGGCLLAIILGGSWHDVKGERAVPPDVQTANDNYSKAFRPEVDPTVAEVDRLRGQIDGGKP